MPKVKQRTYRARRTYKGVRRRKGTAYSAPLFLQVVIALAVGLVVCIGLANITISTFTNNSLFSQFQQSQPTERPIRNGPYVLQGKPSISADFINTILTNYHSPASGKGQALYDKGIKYNIDPVFALAFFMQESNLGKSGIAATTHSLGNIRTTAGYENYHGYRQYATWEDGFEDWYKLISEQYIQAWGLTTIDNIIPSYAPNDDNNNEQQYINAVKYFVDHWRSGYIA